MAKEGNRCSLRQKDISRIKWKLYKILARLAMMYGLEIAALTKRQEAELKVVKIKMLRYFLE